MDHGAAGGTVHQSTESGHAVTVTGVRREQLEHALVVGDPSGHSVQPTTLGR